MKGETSLLLPNLGAEGGDDWQGFRRQESVRVAARLWSALFSGATRIRFPDVGTAFREQCAADQWPEALGPASDRAAFAWLGDEAFTLPWYRSAKIEAHLDPEHDPPLRAPATDIVRTVHDKGFAVRQAVELDLTPASITSLIQIIEPSELLEPGRLLERLCPALAEWPDWTQQRFTFKPRFGSSGRGRVGGAGRSDLVGDAVRGGFGRLAAAGGAVFEPWLDRAVDLSVCLWLPGGGASDLPTLLGSLEMLATPSGGYRGHCGEIDSRGRVFSGHRHDESMRTAAAILAGRAQAAGYFGACGVDGFVFREGLGESARDRLRPIVEMNARATMGLVALGLIRRALPSVRTRLELEPGMRAAFLLGLLPGEDDSLAFRIAADCVAPVAPIDLCSPQATRTIVPTLFFSRDLESLRAAYDRHLDC